MYSTGASGAGGDDQGGAGGKKIAASKPPNRPKRRSNSIAKLEEEINSPQFLAEAGGDGTGTGGVWVPRKRMSIPQGPQQSSSRAVGGGSVPVRRRGPSIAQLERERLRLERLEQSSSTAQPHQSISTQSPGPILPALDLNLSLAHQSISTQSPGPILPTLDLNLSLNYTTPPPTDAEATAGGSAPRVVTRSSSVTPPPATKPHTDAPPDA